MITVFKPTPVKTIARNNRFSSWRNLVQMSNFRVRRDKALYGQHAVILLSKALRKFSNIPFLW